MKKTHCIMFATLLLTMLGLAATAQQASKHILSAEELKKAVPAEYFFRGQKAPVQLRNAVGFKVADGKMTLAPLVAASRDPAEVSGHAGLRNQARYRRFRPAAGPVRLRFHRRRQVRSNGRSQQRGP